MYGGHTISGTVTCIMAASCSTQNGAGEMSHVDGPLVRVHQVFHNHEWTLADTNGTVN